jgi:hypothetical protein
VKYDKRIQKKAGNGTENHRYGPSQKDFIMYLPVSKSRRGGEMGEAGERGEREWSKEGGREEHFSGE